MYRTSIAVLTASLLAGCSMTHLQLSSAPGKLARCDGPHCVSSQDPDPTRRVAPLVYTVAPAAAQATLVEIVKKMESATIAENRPGYVHAVFESKLFSFLDDVEFVLVPGNRIDMRSSSRTGYYDFDVNRKRVEEIRAAFDRTQP